MIIRQDKSIIMFGLIKQIILLDTPKYKKVCVCFDICDTSSVFHVSTG